MLYGVGYLAIPEEQSAQILIVYIEGGAVCLDTETEDVRLMH